jgi:hypothetical protein
MVEEFGLDYFQGQITKYLFRWRQKGGVRDLEKARHFLDKYIETAEKREAAVMAQKCSPTLPREEIRGKFYHDGSNAFGSEKGTGAPAPWGEVPTPQY